MNYTSVLTTCTYCGVGCGMHLQVLDGKVVGVLPAKAHPVSEGRLCIKGWNAHAFLHHPDRLTHPLIRKDGGLQEAGWDEALDLVADRLSSIKAEHGPDAIGVLAPAKSSNEANYLAQKFARAVIGTNNIDQCARLCHSPTVAGLATSLGSGAMTNSVPDLETAECILVTGSNTTEAHPIIGTRLLRAQRRGTRLIVVDPRRIQLARCADLHLRQRPGTDIAWLNGMAHVIIEEGLADDAFIRDRTEGYEEFRLAVSAYPPERVEGITGIPADELRRAARWFGGAERAAIVYCLGITQHTSAVKHVWSIANLAMLTGNVGRPGTGVNPLRGQNNVQGACDMGSVPVVFPGYQAVTDAEIRGKFARAWGLSNGDGPADSLPEKPGLTEMEMIFAAEEGRIRGMYVIGENPAMAEPDLNRVRRGLDNLYFLVVQDIFLSETAQLADVVLPAAAFAEEDGTFTATDRRVQRARQAVNPPGEARPDWRILSDLANRIRPERPWTYEHPSEVMDEIASLVPIYGGVSYGRLEENGFLQWPCRTAEDPGTIYLHKEEFPIGRGIFHVVDHRGPAEVPDEEYPFVLTTGRLMFQYHTGTMTRRSPKLEQELPVCPVEIHPDDARALGLEHRGRVRVRSRRGEIEAVARVTEQVEPGVVFIPFHFAEAAANALTNPALDRMVKIPEYKVCAVRLDRPEP